MSAGSPIAISRQSARGLGIEGCLVAGLGRIALLLLIASLCIVAGLGRIALLLLIASLCIVAGLGRIALLLLIASLCIVAGLGRSRQAFGRPSGSKGPCGRACAPAEVPGPVASSVRASVRVQGSLWPSVCARRSTRTSRVKRSLMPRHRHYSGAIRVAFDEPELRTFADVVNAPAPPLFRRNPSRIRRTGIAHVRRCG